MRAALWEDVLGQLEKGRETSPGAWALLKARVDDLSDDAK